MKSGLILMQILSEIEQNIRGGEELTYDEILDALAEAEYELCLWELGIHDDLETEEI